MTKRIFLVTALFLSLFVTSQAFAATPLGTVQDAVERILSILRDPAYDGGAKSEEQISRVKEIVYEVFDFEVLSRMTLGRDWRRLDAAQQQEFVELYSQLLEKTYKDRIKEYTDEKVVYLKETMLTEAGARIPKAEVETVVKTRDKEVPILYRLYEKNGVWRVYDIHGEGVSLVNNYRTQFDELLHKGTVEDMLKQLRKKVADQAAAGKP